VKIKNYKKQLLKKIIGIYQAMLQNHAFQRKKLLLITLYMKNVRKYFIIVVIILNMNIKFIFK